MIISHSCGARWSGTAKAHCAGCHRTFSTNGVFDRHRRNLSCLDPDTATKKDGTEVFHPRTDRTTGETIWGYPGTWVPTTNEGD